MVVTWSGQGLSPGRQDWEASDQHRGWHGHRYGLRIGQNLSNLVKIHQFRMISSKSPIFVSIPATLGEIDDFDVRNGHFRVYEGDFRWCLEMTTFRVDTGLTR